MDERDVCEWSNNNTATAAANSTTTVKTKIIINIVVAVFIAKKKWEIKLNTIKIWQSDHCRRSAHDIVGIKELLCTLYIQLNVSNENI